MPEHKIPDKNSTLIEWFHYAYRNYGNDDFETVYYGVHSKFVDDIYQLHNIIDNLTPELLKKIIKILKNLT